MIKKICAVYDLKACMFLQPYFAVNAGDGIRAFGDAVVKGEGPISLHPSDYQLFDLGDFDDVKGSIVSLSPLKLLCSASDFVSSDVSRRGSSKAIMETPLVGVSNGK